MKLTVSGTLEFILDEELPPARFLFNVTQAGITYKDLKMLVLPNDHKCVASIQPVDAKGNPAQIEGVPTWTSSSEAIANVVPLQDDGSGTYSAEILPAAETGTCQINVSADADLGSGVTTITGVLDVQVTAGQAVGFTITTAPPVPA